MKEIDRVSPRNNFDRYFNAFLFTFACLIARVSMKHREKLYNYIILIMKIRRKTGNNIII